MKAINILKIVLSTLVFFVCVSFADDIIRYIKVNIGIELITQHPSGGFLIFLHVAMIMSVVLLFPLIFYEVMRYITPALYPHERAFLPKMYHLTWLASFLFLLGVAFGRYVVFSMIGPFLTTFNRFLGVSNIWDAPTTVMFVLLSCFYAGLIFQTPIVIYYLLTWGVINIENIKIIRKVIIAGALIISAVITPPDVFSQIIFGFPIWSLFEISVLVWRFKNDRDR